MRIGSSESSSGGESAPFYASFQFLFFFFAPFRFRQNYKAFLLLCVRVVELSESESEEKKKISSGKLLLIKSILSVDRILLGAIIHTRAEDSIETTWTHCRTNHKYFQMEFMAIIVIECYFLFEYVVVYGWR